jgi:hypothetical protein
VIVAALPLHSRHLRGHPVRRPDEGFPLAQRCRYLFPRGTTFIGFFLSGSVFEENLYKSRKILEIKPPEIRQSKAGRKSAK